MGGKDDGSGWIDVTKGGCMVVAFVLLLGAVAVAGGVAYLFG